MTPSRRLPDRILITAGPTHEPIDRVRYLANRSSGRMGIALAEQAVLRGLSVTLLLGPTHLSPVIDPDYSTQLRVFRFHTTAELQSLLRDHWPDHDVLIMAAAVADFRPVTCDLESKIRRNSKPDSLKLEPTPDLLAALTRIKRTDQVVIGYALEPSDVMKSSALRKLSEKNLDAIVANPLETMNSSQIRAVVLLKTGETLVPPTEMTKRDFADWLLDHLDVITKKCCKTEK